MHSSIIRIDDILISSEILTEYFSCDYENAVAFAVLWG